MNKDSSNKKHETKGLRSQPIIERWELLNFQSIKDEMLDLKSLTIFAGPNSSGKSAVIKSLLMVAQSLSSSAWEVPMVLNGKYTQLGDFDHILHHGSNPPKIELGFLIKRWEGDINVRVEIQKDPNSLASMRVVNHSIISWEDDNELGEELFNLKHNPVKLSESEKQGANQILREQIEQGLFNYEISEPTGIESHPQYEETVSTSLSNFLPGRPLIRVNSESRKITEDIEQLREQILSDNQDSIPLEDRELSKELVQSFFSKIRVRMRSLDPSGKEDNYMKTVREISESKSSWIISEITNRIRRNLNLKQIQDLARRMSGNLPELLEDINNHSKSRGLYPKTELEVREFPPQYSDIIQQIRRVFGNQIFYLGPLRDDPKAIYAIPPLPNQRDVGLKGEYTAAMLDEHKNLIIEYPLPPILEKFNGEYELARGTLGDAVQVWLNRMGLAKSFNTTMTSKVGYQLEIRPEGVKHDLDLMSLGVGVSQVLPTVVMALLAPEDSVLIFEQPEVHLHPKVQSVLGDFFLGIIGCGKQCIVETHSEHLINRIRRRIAESKDEKNLQQLQIYFVELKNGVSQFRSVEPNEFGAILEWPSDFFDEVEKESSAIIRAAMEKRLGTR